MTPKPPVISLIPKRKVAGPRRRANMNEKRSVLRVSVRTSRTNAGRFGSVLLVSICEMLVTPRGSEMTSMR